MDGQWRIYDGVARIRDNLEKMRNDGIPDEQAAVVYDALRLVEQFLVDANRAADALADIAASLRQQDSNRCV